MIFDGKLHKLATIGYYSSMITRTANFDVRHLAQGKGAMGFDPGVLVSGVVLNARREKVAKQEGRSNGSD